VSGVERGEIIGRRGLARELQKRVFQSVIGRTDVEGGSTRSVEEGVSKRHWAH